MGTYSKTPYNRIKRGAKRATYDVAEINAILDAGFIASVGYVFDKVSLCIPMAYGRMGQRLYFHGSQGNRLLKTLLDAEKMSVTVMHLDGLVLARSALHHSVNYRSATLFGTVREVVEPIEKTAALKCITNHMVKGRWPELRTMTDGELNRTLVVEMAIETASAKIRAEGVLDEPEDYKLPLWAGIVPLRQIADPVITDGEVPEDVPIPQHVLEYCKTVNHSRTTRE